MRLIFYHLVTTFLLLALSRVSTTQLVSRLDYTSSYPDFRHSLEGELERDFRFREADKRLSLRQSDERHNRRLVLEDIEWQGRERLEQRNREPMKRDQLYRQRNFNGREEKRQIRNVPFQNRREPNLNRREKEENLIEFKPINRRATERRQEVNRKIDRKTASQTDTQNRRRIPSYREQYNRVSRTGSNFLEIKPSLIGFAFDYNTVLQAVITLTLLLGILRNHKTKKFNDDNFISNINPEVCNKLKIL